MTPDLRERTLAQVSRDSDAEFPCRKLQARWTKPVLPLCIQRVPFVRGWRAHGTASEGGALTYSWAPIVIVGVWVGGWFVEGEWLWSVVSEKQEVEDIKGERCDVMA